MCSGIEAASVAWHPLGWQAAAFSEIEPFPRAVLAHHYPDVPLHGDFTTIEADQYGPVDLLVGGTPCQDFSVAGLRAGIAGDRGNLTLEFLRLASRTKPRWIVWENVPGVLSSDGGRALGAFLGGLGQLGYGFAYRVLDAQYFGLAQRRARVFVVAHLGDWRRAAAVLFEHESLLWNPAPRRETGEGVAPTISARTKGGGGLGTDFDCDGGLISLDVVPAMTTRTGTGTGRDGMDEYCVAHPEISYCLNAGGMGRQDSESESETLIAHSLRAEDFDASEDGTGRGTPLVTAFEWQRGATQHLDMLEEMSPALIKSQTPAIAFSAKDHGADAGPISPTLRSGNHDKSHANGGVMPDIAFESRFVRNGRGAPGTIVPPLKAQSGQSGKGDAAPLVAFNITPSNSNKDYNARASDRAQAVTSGGNRPSARGGDLIASSAVRRLTPRECERLQGFEDDWTLVPYRGKPAADGNRYKALGNSMAVPVMRWIGQRIALVDKLQPLDQRTEAQPAAKRRRPAQVNGAPSNAPLERETHGD